jgi:preprotein translocase subunit SecG
LIAAAKKFRSQNEMNMVLNLLFGVQMLAALAMIGLILVQHGKGADMGAAFGSGSAGSLFGASGSANFLSRSTAALAVVFFVCTLVLAYFGHARPEGGGGSLIERATVGAPPAATEQAPATTPAGSAADIPAGGGTLSAPAAGAPAAPDANQIPSK